MSDDLLKMKRGIEELLKNIVRDEGSLSQLIETLKEQGYKDTEAAVKGLEKINRQIAQKEVELCNQISKIKELMKDWSDQS